MKVLIRDGASFIGSALAIELSKRAERITVLDNISPQTHEENLESSALVQHRPSSVQFIKEDVRDRNAWANVLAGGYRNSTLTPISQFLFPLSIQSDGRCRAGWL